MDERTNGGKQHRMKHKIVADEQTQSKKSREISTDVCWKFIRSVCERVVVFLVFASDNFVKKAFSMLTFYGKN